MAGLVRAAAAPLDDEPVNGLRRLKLRRIRQLAPGFCITARTERWRPEEFLRVLVTEECAARDQQRRAATAHAAFPVVKPDDFDLSPRRSAGTPSTTCPAWSGSHRSQRRLGGPTGH